MNLGEILKFELDTKGVRELLKSDPMKEILKVEAKKVANRAGAGFETMSKVRNTRAVEHVYPKTNSAYRQNFKENTLLKALR